MNDIIEIIADVREQRSGIPAMLLQKDVKLSLEALRAGDYLINNSILVERKTKEDFVLSLIQNRLFDQCKKLKRNSNVHLFIIEGNPYKTNHSIDHEAIKGALLSISVAWQIPMVFSNNQLETSQLLLMAGNQMLKSDCRGFRKGYKPKKTKSRQLYFLQGIPKIGQSLSQTLLEQFGSLKNIVNASENDLMQVKGIGSCKATEIVEFLNCKYAA